MEGRLEDPHKAIEPIIERVRNKTSEIYGEKNVTYAPFITHLYESLKCKFIFLKRDGRDVVRSLIDWHNQLWGNIYRESKDLGDINPRALKTISKIPIHKDTSDYARPRPTKNDPHYDNWLDLSRFEMCSYYWTYINDLAKNELAKIPKKQWIELDYTNPSIDEIQKVIDFLELKGISQNKIKSILERKINSLKDRIGTKNSFPNWRNWDSKRREQFDNLASQAMYRFGYYRNDGANWKPPDYGKIWEKHENPHEWYAWMYDDRIKLHQDLISWIKTKNIDTIGDFGCGHAIGYLDELAKHHYTGIDLSPQNIEYCMAKNRNPQHSYLLRDFIIDPLPESSFDLSFSMGTLDNTYDIPLFIQRMLESSKKWIYLTCFRGWFPGLLEHKYQWRQEEGCFYNDISPIKIRETLEEYGCRESIIKPTISGKVHPKHETLIIAEKREAYD